MFKLLTGDHRVHLTILALAVTFGCQDQVTYKRPVKTARPAIEGVSADQQEANREPQSVDNIVEEEATEDAPVEDPNVAADPAAQPVIATGQVSFSTLISTPVQQGRYAPDRLQAFWISDQNDQHIRTIDANPGRRPQHLRRWRVANGDQVDGFTGATITDFADTPTTLAWDLKDKNGAQVNFGDYKIWFEMTQSNTNAGFVDGDPGYSLYSLSFSIKPEGFTIDDNNHPSFTNISITHTP